MHCGGIRAKRLLVAAALLGAGLSLLYFTGSEYSYNVPLLSLAAPAVLVIILLLRQNETEKGVALSLIFVSITAALPLFYASALVLSDAMRSSGNVPPALRGLYNVFPGEFPYFLALILFAIYLSAIAFFKAFEDVFEALVYIERLGILRFFAARRIGPMEIIGLIAGAATSVLSLKMGYSSVILLPFLFYAKVQVLLGAALTAIIVDIGKVGVNIYAAAAATALYFLLKYKLFSRYTGDAVAAVKKPMRMFYSSIALLIILLVFFIVFQEKAPILTVIFLLSLLPFLLAIPLTEIGVLSLPLAAVLVLSGKIMYRTYWGLGEAPGGWQLMAFILASGILGIQFASYSTIFTSREELEECHLGVLETITAFSSVLIATWYYRIHTPKIQHPTAPPSFSLLGVIVPLVALAASIIHMVVFTPLVSEGAMALGLNIFNPLGIFVGVVFPSKMFAATAVSALILKLLDVKAGGRLSKIMNGFIYGVGIGLMLSIVIANAP